MKKEIVISLALISIILFLDLISGENCNSELVNSSYSEWVNFGECEINNNIVQERNFVQYDLNSCGEFENQTFYEYRNISCNYCEENISVYYTDWSNCKSDNTKSRKKYFRDLNYNSCCAVTHLDSDCQILNQDYQNTSETQPCKQFNLIINNPIQGQTYKVQRLNFDIISDANLTRLDFIDYADLRSRWRTLCRNCRFYNKTFNFIEGYHNISVKGFLANDKNSIESVSFFVDSKKPYLYLPRIRGKSYTNGTWFSFNYTEDNLKDIKLIYDDESVVNYNCSSGKNKNCLFNLDLKKYDGEEIDYSFIYRDIANNTINSSLQKINVDTTSPRILYLDYPQDGIFVYFYMNISEKNFKDVSYFDHSERNPKWRLLCSSLINGICQNKQKFSVGEHNLTLKVSDKAGNFVTTDI